MDTDTSMGFWIRLPRVSANKPATRTDLFSGVVPFLGMGFGSGLLPKAPGTFGTVVAVPLAAWAALAGPEIYGLLTVGVVILGVPICGETARRLGTPDHQAIVWDEMAGFMVTMWFVPMTWEHVLVGFVLFRLFDILKPWPIRWIDQHLQGGFGIMMDDVLAGLLAALCLYLMTIAIGLDLFSRAL